MAANAPAPGDLDLTGRVAVVTGAAAGLGRAEAIGLARSGATVVVNDMPQALENLDVCDEITSAGSTAVAAPRDVSLRSTADEMVACAERLGGLHVVVNNAGSPVTGCCSTCPTRTGIRSSPSTSGVISW